MKIRTKLLAVFSPLVILLIAVLILGRSQSISFQNLGETLESNYNLTVIADRIQDDIKDEAISLRNLLIYQDETLIQNEINKIELLNDQVAADIEVLSSYAIKNDNVQIMNDLSDRVSTLDQYEKQIIDLVHTGDIERATLIMNQQGSEIHEEIQMIIGDLTDLLESRMYTSIENESDSFNRQVIYASISLAIITCAFMLLLLRFIWSFSSRLFHVSHVMSNIASENFALSTKVQVIGDDEIDDVAKSFNRMTDTLEENTNRLELQNEKLTEATIALEEKAKELELASKYKSEFLANMSHELRTPLNSMLVLSKLLAENKEGTLNSKQIEYAQTIHSSTGDLHDIINDILDLSKIEYGNMTVDATESSVEAITKEMELHFKPVAEEKGIVYEVILHEDVPAIIYTDDKKLKQVLRNLIANAIKFTNEGKVKLEVSLEESSSESPLFKFSVSDTGIGIAEENKRLIFQAFQQEDGSTSRKYGGTGLGLSISKEIVTLLGGEIILESEQGVGSDFKVFIRNYDNEKNSSIDQAINQAKQVYDDMKVRLGEEYSSLVGKHVLLIDNDIQNIYRLLSIFEEQGVMIQFAADEQEALDLLKVNAEIDLILVYVKLFETNNMELMNNIRKIEAYTNIPIVVIGTVEEGARSEEILRAGASDFIRRPIEATQLLGVIKRLINN
ncbi:ATP-binding protein [Oceanobacillus sp. CAU 1775]